MDRCHAQRVRRGRQYHDRGQDALARRPGAVVADVRRRQDARRAERNCRAAAGRCPQLFRLLQSLAEKGAKGEADPQAWSDAVRQSFNFPGADAALLDNPLARALRELAGQGARGFEQMMENLKPAMTEARALLDLPAFGYAREHQEHYQQMAKAWLDYQHETNRDRKSVVRESV